MEKPKPPNMIHFASKLPRSFFDLFSCELCRGSISLKDLDSATVGRFVGSPRGHRRHHHSQHNHRHSNHCRHDLFCLRAPRSQCPLLLLLLLLFLLLLPPPLRHRFRFRVARDQQRGPKELRHAARHSAQHFLNVLRLKKRGMTAAAPTGIDGHQLT